MLCKFISAITNGFFYCVLLRTPLSSLALWWHDCLLSVSSSKKQNGVTINVTRIVSMAAVPSTQYIIHGRKWHYNTFILHPFFDHLLFFVLLSRRFLYLKAETLAKGPWIFNLKAFLDSYRMELSSALEMSPLGNYTLPTCRYVITCASADKECNDNHRGKSTGRMEFKFWTRLFA